MRRILLVTSVIPWPLRRNGGAQRSRLLVKALQKWGQVDIVCVGGNELAEFNDPSKAQLLRDNHIAGCFVRENVHPKRQTWLGPFNTLLYLIQMHTLKYKPDPKASKRVADLLSTHQYDLVVGRYLQPSMQAAIQYFKGPKLLDFDDIDFSTLQNQITAKPWAGINGKIGAKLAVDKVRKYCFDAMESFNTVFVTSDEDRQMLKHDHLKVLPNIPFNDNETNTIDAFPPSDSKDLLFVGDLQFPPNRDGIDRFLTNIWPTVHSKVPGSTVTIVGRGLSDADRGKWSAIAGTNVIGFADSVAECYRNCALSISPLYYGGGTKIKVLESLAYGRTLVGTDHAVRGYNQLTTPIPSVAVANSDTDFADACVMLLTNPTMRNTIASRGMGIVNNDFSFAKFQQVVDDAVTAILK